MFLRSCDRSRTDEADKLKGLAIKYNPSYDRKVGNKKSDMSGCDLCDWDARNDLE